MIASSVPEGVTAGTFALDKFGKVAFVAPDVAGPTIATTLSFVVKLAVTEAASLLSDLLSFKTYSIFLPSIPPSLLICSTANLAPSFSASPYAAMAPDNSKFPPILIVFASSLLLLSLALGAPQAPNKNNPAASAANVRFFIPFPP